MLGFLAATRLVSVCQQGAFASEVGVGSIGGPMSSKSVRLIRIAGSAALALAAVGGTASAQSERPLRIKYDYVPHAQPGGVSPRIGPGTIIYMNRVGGQFNGTEGSTWNEDSRS